MRHCFYIARFEFSTRARRISSLVYFFVFFALSFLWMAASGGAFPDADMGFGAAHLSINSPYALARLIVTLTAFAMIVVAAIMGRAVQEDIEYRTASFFASAPITKGGYLLGRFLGAYGVVALILAAAPLGAWCATFLPGIVQARLETNQWYAYVRPYLLLALPDGLVIGTLFFFLAAVTRRMLPVYIGSVLIIILWIGSSQWMHDIDQRLLVAISDPFGSRAVTLATRYWTAPERNHRPLQLTGALLDNRLIWLAIAALVAALGSWRFTLPAFASNNQGGRQELAGAKYPPVKYSMAAQPYRADRLRFSLIGLALRYLRSILGNIYFGVLVFAGVALAITLAISAGRIYGTATWPVTFQMVDLLTDPFVLFMLIIITFYAGELIWHERDVRIDQMVDASAVPSHTLYLAKLLALMAVPALLQLVLMVCGIAIQLSHDYTHLEIGLYLHDLFGIQLIELWFLCALALTVHALVNHKYLSHFLLALFYIALIASSALGLEDNLYRFGETADISYSDMNGFGHTLVALRAFEWYWGAFSVLLLVAGYLFVRRGTPQSWGERWAEAKRRITPLTAGVSLLGLLCFIGVGCWIYYNTHILNEYQTASSAKLQQAEYETTYRAAMVNMLQPKIASVSVAIEIDPVQRSLKAHGRYLLDNRTSQPISFLNVDFPSDLNFHVSDITLDRPFTRAIDDQRLGMRQLHLNTPLLPGERTSLEFDVALSNPGFAAGHEETAVVGNGSFFNGRLLLPHIGYDADGELTRAADRTKYHLPARRPMRTQTDPVGLATNYIADDADLIDFDADISTAPDQLAVAPGRLVRSYESRGKKHYVYQGTLPMLNFFAFQSARYAVARDVWHGPHGDLPIVIDYQPGHEFDLQRMFAGVRDALSYNSANFAPYQYQEFRIVEFPRYQLFAESFPNTTPYSEGLGFIARVNDRDPKDIDYPYFVTAHEVSHQWWGYQMVGANVQGATMLSETLAQYSALMVLKHRYGDARMRRFLAFELDSYLAGRASEPDREVPLEKVEGQTYIHYNKGSIVMYALQDALGEDVVNHVLADMLKAHSHIAAPYPISTELVQRFKDAAPPELKGFVTDLFERIFDNRAVSAKAKRQADNSYLVTVEVHAEKRRADENGNETVADLDDWIDVGALDASGNALKLQREHFTSSDKTFSFVVPELPARAGIDPLHKLIDRTPSENTVAVQLEQ
jgi:ABC-2 type transport system permease protein